METNNFNQKNEIIEMFYTHLLETKFKYIENIDLRNQEIQNIILEGYNKSKDYFVAHFVAYTIGKIDFKNKKNNLLELKNLFDINEEDTTEFIKGLINGYSDGLNKN